MKVSFEAIGTLWTVETERQLSASIQEKVTERIEEFDTTYSRFRKDSLVGMIAAQAGRYEFPEDFFHLISMYQKAYALTDGLVTPLVGRALEQAGYDSEYSLQPKQVSRVPAWEEIITTEGRTLTVSEPVTLDFGAAGKGYLVDLIADLLKESGVNEGVVDAGGDLVVWGREERVGLEHPEHTSEVIGIAHIKNGSLCGSSGNRRSWEGYTHILNPASLSSPQEVLAVWTYASTGLLADMAATCLFFATPDTLQGLGRFEYALLREGGELEYSQAFPAEYFLG